MIVNNIGFDHYLFIFVMESNAHKAIPPNDMCRGYRNEETTAEPIPSD